MNKRQREERDEEKSAYTGGPTFKVTIRGKEHEQSRTLGSICLGCLRCLP